MNDDIARLTAGVGIAEAGASDIEAQRQQLQRRIEALQDAGALPAATAADAASSVAQWSNWSNG